MGIGFEQAHFFAMFISNFAFLTPPVAMAALIASKLAEASYVKTAAESVKTALGGFTIPFLFIYCPIMLLLPQDPIRGVTGLIASLLFLFSMEITFVGYYMVDSSIPERIFTGASGILFFLSIVLSSVALFAVGLALVLSVTLFQWRKKAFLAPSTALK
jgi:TRAP-type uncharacterized transport system fused permease subunit